jgi:hypothetical protein
MCDLTVCDAGRFLRSGSAPGDFFFFFVGLGIAVADDENEKEDEQKSHEERAHRQAGD